jgi:ParB family transcriptional regulator, chromosome partitioning protein
VPKSTTAAPAAQTAAVLEIHDPATLLPGRNVRLDPRLDHDFIESVGEFGVLQPCVGYRTEGGRVCLKMGQRRRLAAIEKGVATVLVVVYPTEADTPAAEIERILSQLAENEHRTGLKTTEVAKAIQDALDLGLPVEDLVRRRRMSRQDVKAAQAVVRSEAAGKAADRHHLTLGQAAGLAEFEDNTEAAESLIQAAGRGPGAFEHSLQRLRDHRDEVARDARLVDEARAALEADGVTVLDKRPDSSSRLSQLRDADGQVLTPETHSGCAGHAAFLSAEWAWKEPGPADDEAQEPDAAADDDADEEEDEIRVAQVDWYCTDPEGSGHQLPSSLSGRRSAPVPDPEAASEERRRVLANNKAWRSAEKVRRRWLAELLSRKTPPAGAVQFLIEELARGDHSLRRALEDGHRFAQPLLGLTELKPNYGRPSASAILDALATASSNRAQVIGLALVLGACEAATGVHTWRDPIDAASGRYFAALKRWGYPLSDVEQIVLAAAGPA